MEFNQVSSVPLKNDLDSPKITLYSHDRVIIENYRGIVLYSDETIEINTKDHLIKLTGQNLSIKYMIKEETEITGDIQKIELLK